MKITTGDKLRIALAPLHVAVGGVLIYHFVADTRTPMVLAVGVGFIAFGIYKLALIRRGLKARR